MGRMTQGGMKRYQALLRQLERLERSMRKFSADLVVQDRSQALAEALNHQQKVLAAIRKALADVPVEGPLDA